MARASCGGIALALPVALGAALGDGVALLLSFAGIGAILKASETAFAIIRLVGVGYILWVGARMLFTSQYKEPTSTRLVHDHAFEKAFLLAALHPASLVFFVAYVPIFIAPTDPMLPQFATMAASFVGLGVMSVLAWATLASLGRNFLKEAGVARRAQRFAGAAIVLLGVFSLVSALQPVLLAQTSLFSFWQ